MTHVRYHLKTRILFGAAIVAVAVLALESWTRAGDAPKQAAAPAVPKAAGPQWTSLFDGKSLKGWKVTQFGGEGPVEVKNGELRLGIGNDLTGVTIDHPVPRSNY